MRGRRDGRRRAGENGGCSVAESTHGSISWATCRAAATRWSGCWPRSASRPRATTWCCWATWSTAARPRWPRCSGCAAWATPPPACWATTTCTCWPWRTACAAAAPRRHASDDILGSPDRDALARLAAPPAPGAPGATAGCCVHAGVVPQWDAAHDAGAGRRGRGAAARARPARPSCSVMYGNEPARWSDTLRGAERWRFVVNVLTRIRFCTRRRHAGLQDQGRRRRRAAGLSALVRRARPAHRRAADGLRPLVARSGLIDRPDLLALDTGCVWGGAAHRGARRRRPARSGAGGVRTGAGAGLKQRA